ncbi:SprT-like domain-containing protein [Halorientalis halophila]|uniref:SprT family zinc-dependent metalloprotease n=1 Tax=Halorientalis halophila TaxID=3108499 RepID=UPI0030093E47
MRKQTTLDANRFHRPTQKQDPQSKAALLERAPEYARAVDLDVDVPLIDWKISQRAKRYAGCCEYNHLTEQITITLAWAAYEEYGWAEFTGTIRHELIHAWEFQHFGESTHGERFLQKAREIGAPRYCRPFTEARLQLVCINADCGWHLDRHRASKSVTHPDDGYRCGRCKSRYEVRHVDSGACWRTNDEYERVREWLGDDW